MDQLPKDFLEKSTEQIAMQAVKEFGYKPPFYLTLKDSADYAVVILVEQTGPTIVAQVTTAEIFRFPVHVMISDRTGKPATYAVPETERKPRLRVVK